jgi:hypothetical protein
MMPIMEDAQWSVETVARSLSVSFPQGLPPLGLSGVEARFVPLRKTNQVPR